MNSGIVYEVSAGDRTARVTIEGKSEPEGKAYKYPKNLELQVGDVVGIDQIEGSDRIIVAY